MANYLIFLKEKERLATDVASKILGIFHGL